MSRIRDMARRELEAFSTGEVSSRSLGLLRVFGALSIYYQFASPWVSHRMDNDPDLLPGSAPGPRDHLACG